MRYFLFLFSSSFYGQVLPHKIHSSQRKTAVFANGTNNRQQGVGQNLWSKYISSPINSTDIKTVTYQSRMPLLAVLNFTLLGFIKSQF